MFDLPTIAIVTKKKKVKNGHVYAVFLRHTHQGKARYHSLKMNFPKGVFQKKIGQWINPKKIGTAKELNHYLTKIYVKASEIVLQNQVWDFDELKKIIFGGKEKTSFEGLHEKSMQSRLNRGTKRGTLKNYKTYGDKIKTFAPGLMLEDVDLGFIENYEIWLRDNYPLQKNSINKHLRYLRSSINEAIKQGSMQRNPFDAYEMRWEKKVHTPLSIEEVEKLTRLYNSNTIIPQYQNVLQYFLFSCATGLGYAEILKLKKKDFNKIGVTWYISNQRKKTNSFFKVPLNDAALALVVLPFEHTEESAFRVITNQKTNQYLKDVVALVGIRKRVTYHLARHTFTSIAIGHYGMSSEIVKNMLGHSKSSMTDHYTTFNPQHLKNEMEKWQKKEEKD